MVKLLLILASVNFWLMASQFQLSQSNNSLTFSMGELSMEQVGEYTRIKDHNVGTLLNDGMPELPVFFNFLSDK